MRTLPALALVLCAVSPVIAVGHKGYYRYPALNDGTLVFCAEGDLWKTGIEGGVAQRLTTHPADESRPSISPDGSTLAFSASYEGPTEVYTMSIDGGLPVRRTYEGEAASVAGWTPEGTVLYSTRKFSTLPETQLVVLDPATGSRTLLPLAQASDGSFDAPGRTLFFTRFAAQPSHTKRYKGGTAQSIWKFSTGGSEAEPMTSDYAGTSKNPMFWEGRVYFVSDRDGTMNLWSMDALGRDLRQHTHHAGWDVKDPSLSRGRIAYQLGADLRIFEIASNNDREIAITLVSDFDQMREHWIQKPIDYLTTAHLSPTGDRLVLTARGQVFVAPVKQGRFVEATRKKGVRYRQARFLNAEALAVLSDESGETEWWKLEADGIGTAERLTKDGKVLRFDGLPSPDGKWIAHYDQDQELWLSNVSTRESTKIDFSPNWGYDGLTWSPDSRWLAYSRPGDNQLQRIFLYDLSAKRGTALTTERYDSFSPSFNPDGKWLYFLSDRHFRSLVRSPWGSRQPEPFFDQQTKIFLVGLKEGLRSPFEPDDELHPAKSEPKQDEKKNEKKDEPAEGEGAVKPAKVEIDLHGIEHRLREVPIPPGNYDALTVTSERLYWLSRETTFEGKRKLMSVPIKNKDLEAKPLVEDVRSYELSSDSKKLMLRKGDDFYVIDAPGKDQDTLDSKVLDKGKVALAGWTFSIDPREEWRQIFVESWRLERDYFYDRSMHAVDWKGMLRKYLPLVDRVTNRRELADLQAQMAGELSALHTFVGPGDLRKGPDDVTIASLGAVLTRDEAGSGYRVSRLFSSDPDRPEEVGPLERTDVGVHEGDVVEAIDGTPTLSASDPGALLRNRDGKQVRLRVRSGKKPARDVIVEPISSDKEADLRYDDWELTRRKMVEEHGGGKIGYVHLRAMGGDNIAEWQREFYPVFDRQGLIIDVRHNRGGNIDSWILGKLLRRPWFYWQPRIGQPYWNMQFAFRGHIAVIIDAFTASDGEAFAEGFRRLGLGKLIGTRTWGGEIWLTSSNVLVDKGIVTAAEFGVYGPEGQWLIEGHGVDPDMIVDNLPHATFGGEDAQLRAAVVHLEKLIREDPRLAPPAPPYPDKSLRPQTEHP